MFNDSRSRLGQLVFCFVGREFVGNGLNVIALIDFYVYEAMM